MTPERPTQHEIVALVEANQKLAEIFEKKIQARLAEIWGEKKTI